jgi:hypothetical protein
MWMVWSARQGGSLAFAAAGALTSGRMPTKMLSTSLRDGGRLRYSPRFRARTRSLPRGQRLVGGVLDRRVGGADDGAVVPGNGEQHAAVAGTRHHDGGVTAQEGAVEHEMDALAGRHHGLGTSGCAMRRVSSVKMPVALTTTFACAS